VGLFNKIKDILFDEVEEEETSPKSVEKVVEPKEETKIAEKIDIQPKVPERQTRVIEPEPEVEEEKEDSYDAMNERDLFKTDNNFPFLDFDEEEFSNSIGTRKEKPTTNVLEFEKKKKIEKRYDFGRVETKEIVEKKKFKPSPIISPVYGILNEDYRIEDIQDKTEENAQNNLDFNSVRRKAFGDTLEEVTPKEEPNETYYEETITVKLKDSEEEQKEKAKTIDELLEDTADVTIDTKDEEEKNNTVSDYDKIEADLAEVVESKKKAEDAEVTKRVDLEEDNTLESDLFDLIDSMYDDREDGDN